MSSIFIQDCDPGECSACAMWLRGPMICSITRRFTAEDCPLRPVYSKSDEQTPLSHIDYMKIIVRTNGDDITQDDELAEL